MYQKGVGDMANKTLVLTDLEGALISSRRPDISGRKYMVVTRNKWDKKAMTHENMQKLKELGEVADIVPMTKLSAKQSCGMALCTNIPMYLVESGALLLNGIVPDKKWRINTLQITYEDNEIYNEGIKFLYNKGYQPYGTNEFTIDYVLQDKDGIGDDLDGLKDIIGSRYNVYRAGVNRIYAYHCELSRRKMVKKFIEMHDYEKIISICAANTGWLQENGTSISIEGTDADITYPKNLYDEDLHEFTSFALNKALEIAKQ